MKNKIREFIDVFGIKFLKGFVVVFSGQTFASLFNMLSMLIFINYLGSNTYGEFVMIQASTTLVYSIFSFKGFQALIHFLNKSKNKDEQMGYLKSVFCLDIISLIISVVVCLFFTETLCRIMGWDNDMSQMIKLFTFTLITNFSGTTTGVISTYQKYTYLVNGQIISSVTKIVLYVIIFFTGFSLTKMILIEVFIITLSNLISLYYTYKILKDKHLNKFYLSKCIWGKEFIKFNISSNITSTIDLPVNQIATFIINNYLGFEFNAIYSVFEKIGSIMNKIITPLGQILFPEISKKISDNKIKEALKLVRNSQLLIYSIFVLSVIFVLSTYKLWFHFFLDNPNQYILHFIVYLFYICYVGATSPVHSIFISLGYINYTPYITIIINVIYLILLLTVIQILGLLGVIIAFILQAMSVVFVKKIIMKKGGYRIA